MTELEKAIMNPKDEATAESDENITPDESVHESFVEVERLKKEIEEENDRLNLRFEEVKKPAAPKRRYHYIGTLSAAASLVLMGIAMTLSLFSPVGVLSALKLAPLMLVFLGLEIAFAMYRNRTLRIRYNLKSLILTVLLIAVSFAMSLISINNSVTGGERYYAEERLQNMLEREISREMPTDIIKDVAIEIHLYGSDPAEYDNITDLQDSDVIDLEITYTNAQVSIYEFASNCRRIMDSFSKMPYNFGTIKFIANDDINSYTMDVNWLYQSTFSTTELIPLVNYFGNDIVMDIPDLIDE